MGLEYSEEKKSFLYDDFLKVEENRGDRNTIMSSNHSSACDSSSSGFTTPFGSELGSSEGEDGDFADELSRQMAECMLREEDEEEKNSVTESASIYELNSNRPSLLTPCTMSKNQFPVGNQVGIPRGGRVHGAELTQHSYGRFRDRDWRSGAGRKGHIGSGMQAVFLGGPGSRNGSSGTGVFLPRATNDSVALKKKSGLSTVLIPTRVLEALELHFKSHSDSASPQLTTAGSPYHASPRDGWMRSKGQGNNTRTKFGMESGIKVDEMQILPQEWTY